MQLERKSYDFEVKATSDDGGTFEGYAACLHNLDSYNDIIAKGAFVESIPDFVKNGIVAWQHDWATPIGKPLSAVEDAKGLYCKAMISDTAAGRDARTLMKDGVVKKLSIGFRCMGREWLEDGDAVKAYWTKAGFSPSAEDEARAQYGARLITKAKLYEFSPVSVPANSLCDITQAKSGPLEGRSLDDHSTLIEGAVEEYMERLESLAELRAQEGRKLGEDRRHSIDRMIKRLDVLVTRAKTLVEEPEEKNLPGEAAQLFAVFQSINATLNGVHVG